MYDYNCPDCNEAKLQSDKNARKINEVIEQVNALIQVNNETVDFIEEKANEAVEEVAEIKVNEVLGDLRTEIDNMKNNKVFVKNFENVQNAIDYCEVIGIKNVELHFESKEYLVENLIFKSEITYVGNGCILSPNNTSSSNKIAIFEDLNNFEVKNITFNGSSNVNTVIEVLNCNNYKFDNCKISNGLEYGCNDYKSNYGTYNNIEVYGNNSNHFNHSALQVNSNNITFNDCKFNNNNGNGVRIWGDINNKANTITFNNCEANNNKQHGFLGNPTTPQYKPFNIRFMCCKANNNGSEHIYSGFAGHYIDNLIIENCIASGNIEHGIVLMDGSYNIVNGCSIYNNLQSGIRIQGDFIRPEDEYTGVNNSIVCNNIINSNGVYANTSTTGLNLCNGISIEGKCSKISITNNQIINNKGYAIRIFKKAGYTDCSNICMDNNIIIDNGRDGTIGDVIFDQSTDKSKNMGSNYINGIISTLNTTAYDRKIKYSVTSVDISAETSSVTLPSDYDMVRIRTSVSKNINTINIPNIETGHLLTLLFEQNSSYPVILSPGGNIKVGTAEISFNNSDTAQLVFDGTNWRLLTHKDL